MKVSYNQLQSYFTDKLPEAEKLAEALTFGVFEIDGMEKVVGEGKSDGDLILDIKVLPDRANYAKSIDGIAREISTVCNLKRKPGMAVAPAPRPQKISIKASIINEVLGTQISAPEMAAIFARMDIGVEQKGGDKNVEFSLSIPSDRPDLQTWRDIPEEIGRIYGYNNIAPVLPANDATDGAASVPAVQKTFYYSEKIRNILTGLGFSEMYGYALVSKGDYEIEKSVAADKNFLRVNLIEGMAKSLETNAKNADLLSLDEIKIFEIGKVFPAAGEHLSFSIGIKNTKRKKQTKDVSDLKMVIDELGKQLGKDFPPMIGTVEGPIPGSVYEINLDEYIAALPEPKSYADLNLGKAAALEYKKFSLQPFIRRDIAVWVSSGINETAVKEIISKTLAENAKTANLEIKIISDAAFDTFSKDGKTSYAFGMTFQSFDRTLTDDEANVIMDKVYEAMKEKGWEVR